MKVTIKKNDNTKYHIAIKGVKNSSLYTYIIKTHNVRISGTIEHKSHGSDDLGILKKVLEKIA